MEAARVAQVVASRCLAVRVRRLARVVTRIYDRALEPHGVTTAQFNLLAAIAVAKGAPPARLGQVLDVEKSTLCRDLKRMAELGWVRVEASAPGRGRSVTLTPAGERLLVEIQPAWEKAQEKARASLPPGVFPRLMKLLG